MRARGQVDGPRSDREPEIVRVKEEGLGAKSQTRVRGQARGHRSEGWGKSGWKLSSVEGRFQRLDQRSKLEEMEGVRRREGGD